MERTRRLLPSMDFSNIDNKSVLHEKIRAKCLLSVSMKQLELCGYCTESGRFLLATRPLNDHSSTKNATFSSSTPLEKVERAFVDLQHWDRLLRCTSSSNFQRLPTKLWRKLMELNWIRGNACAGWRVELQISVLTCEKCMNHAFTHLSTHQQREFLDDHMYAALKQKIAAARADNRHARDLQQYFIIRNCCAVVAVLWRRPVLLRAGAQYVVGYEIDDKLQPVATQSVARAVADVATRSGTLPRARETIHAQFYQGDFLVSRSCFPAH
ncbi:hypothetical protein PsorP6_004948 [Peronosclerospora sorghi]|uniref:Uncharacterized protein n=1 Tax=Peronosclerospora sorghi TaxID=230839 RepID=A0ACC0W5N9_9STRA|nr:hypothetical protein PsorP6_004948 [Peronosclerospora sorghi]